MDEKATSEVSGIYLRRLNSSKKEIRLLRLHPIEDKDDFVIKCSLQITSLEDKPAYNALSYMWGNDDVRYEHAVKTQVSGQDVQLTFNLMMALLYLRPRVKSASLIWIDALCINQKDDKEKAGQIPLMREIYQNSIDVLVWLGKEADQSELAMDFVNEAREYVVANPEVFPPLQEWTRTRLHDPSYAERWKALSQLCSRPYWSRCWIVQEIVAHSRPVLLCGWNGLQAPALFEMINHLWQLAVPGIDTNPPMVAELKRKTLSLIGIVSVWTDSFLPPEKKSDLLELIIHFKNFKCSNPRDRIYSLLGIAKPYDIPPLLVDYESSMPTFYRDVAVHIIRGSRSLDILRFAIQGSYALHRIPSWVPDWTYNGDSIHEPIFSNESGLETYQHGEVEILSGDVLKVKAHIIGPIEALVSCQTIGDETSAMEELTRWTRSVGLPVFTIPGQDVQEVISTALRDMAITQYKTLFFTWEKTGMIQANWPEEEFIPLVQSLWKDGPQHPHLTAEWCDLLRRAMPPYRRFLKCKLPDEILISWQVHLLGSCSKAARIGDMVAVLPGCSCPVVLKALHEPHHYEVVSAAYVYALMDRSALKFFPVEDIFLH